MLLTTAAAVADAAAALPLFLFCVSSSPFHLVRAIAVDIVTYFCRLRLSLSFLAQLIHLVLLLLLYLLLLLLLLLLLILLILLLLLFLLFQSNLSCLN